MDCIKAPNKGERITADWARRVTEAANAFGSSTDWTTDGKPNLAHGGASAFPFKLTRNAATKSKSGYTICLPPGCITYGDEVIDASYGLTASRIDAPDLSSSSSGSTKEVAVDGRFDHVFDVIFEGNVAPGNGETTPVWGAIVKDSESGEKRLRFYAAETFDVSGGTLLAKFPIARVTVEVATATETIAAAGTVLAYRIEQIAVGGVHLGGTASGALIVQITGGDSVSGYTGTIIGTDGSETESDKLFLPEIAYGYDLPTGTRILAHAVDVLVIGGSES